MSSTVQQAVKTLSDQTKQLFFISLRTSYLIATFTRKRKKGSMDPPCPLQIHGNGESPHQYNRPPTMLSAICICTISQNRVRNRLSAVSSKSANFQCIFLLRKEKYISLFNCKLVRNKTREKIIKLIDIYRFSRSLKSPKSG